MTQSSSHPDRQFRGKLTRTSLLLLLPLALIPVTIVGVLTLTNTNDFLRDQIITQFINVGDKQSELITDSVRDREAYVQTISKDTTFRFSLDALLESAPDSDEFHKARGEILTNYGRLSRTQTEAFFSDLLVVSPDKEILVSTYPLWEGKILDQDIYHELISEPTSIGLFNVFPFYTEEVTDQFLVFSSQPVYDDQGTHTGTIIGVTGPATFQHILELGTLSYAETRPYYITNPDGEGMFVGLSTTTGELTTFSPSDDHIKTLLPKIMSNDKEGVLEFQSFNNLPVLGFIKWIPAINAALVLEVPQTIISDPLQNLAYLQIALLLIALVVLGIVIWQGTRRIAQPILQVSQTAQNFAFGDMRARALVNRNDEIGLLAYSFNQVADQLVTLYLSLESLVESRTRQIRTAAEVAQVITSATSLDEMLSRTVNLIVERFNHYHAAIYLLDRSGDHAVLREAAGEAAEEISQQGFRLAVGSRSIIGTVSATNKPWVAYDVKQDPYYMEFDPLPETQSEVAVPLSIGGKVLGVLDVQSNKLNAFDEEDITTLQTLAGQAASAIQNVQTLENTQIDLESANLLFQTSHRLADANSIDDIFQVLGEILRQVPLISVLFILEGMHLQALEISSKIASIQSQETKLSISEDEISQIATIVSWDIISTERPPEGFPSILINFAKEIDCQAFTLMPLMSGDRILGLTLYGAAAQATLTPVSLQPYYSINEMANTAIEKTLAIEAITEHLTELQSLSAISDAISTETGMRELFEILHRQVTQAIGDINFLVALYDTKTQLIEIPYMDEDGEIVSIPSFPLGQGLTSIVIRTQEPLMIIQDTVNRARALGAIVTSDRPAKSWLGVPMLVGGEVVGAIVVQDTEHEQRFNDDDRRLLATLAGQVAPTVRNTRLLAAAQIAAERDRQLYEVTDAIRRSTSMEEILETTTRELSQILHLKKASIQLAPDSTSLENRDNGTEEKTA